MGDLTSRQKSHGNLKWILILSILTVFIVSTIITTDWLASGAVQGPFAEWETQDLGDNGGAYDFNEIVFVNSTHGWVIGWGILLNTNDSGDTWNIVIEERTLRGLSLISLTDIWVGGSGHLYHSIDGGASWNTIEGPTEGPTNLAFFNSTHGFAGDVDKLFRTTDGGVSWDDVTMQSGHYIPSDFQLTATTVRIASWTGIFRSDDWGETWYTEFDGRADAIDFISDDEGWSMNGANSYMYFNGEHWVDLEDIHRIGVSSLAYSRDVDFIDSNNGWVVGLSPSVAYTPDGGHTWYSQEWYGFDVRGPLLKSVFFLNETHGWAAGSYGIIASTTTGNLLGEQLYSGFFLTTPLSSGGRLIPYTSLFVGVVVTAIYLTLLLVWIRKRFRSQMVEARIENSKQDGPMIR
ncbi:MAG: hypothetical protein E4H14_18620 [Candidatus Thorarchaeota archaeon]|nr:MAG: hypothetical protein E4H14_18620 [Candidatus Thorarchaeota archaeon]